MTANRQRAFNIERSCLTLAAWIGSCLLVCAPALAQDKLETAFVGFFEAPVELTAPPGDERLFVAEQNTGRVRIVRDGQTLPTPFLDVSSKLQSGGEQGMLGLAFDPFFNTSGYVFVAYTRVGGDTLIERYQVQSSNPDLAPSWTARQVLVLPQFAPNHNGGCLRFGADGYLYIGSGDGGASNDPNCNAQNLNSLLGKVLRINVGSIDSTGSYSIPPTNPFVGWPGAREEIWLYGMRNPWRFSFDRQTGDLWIGDVGEAQREEVDIALAGQGGLNFGWRVTEGSLCNGGACGGSPDCSSPSLKKPVFEYGHDAAGGCSIIGGYVYRGCAIPALWGTYFCADYCSSKIWTFKSDGFSISELQERQSELASSVSGPLTQITSFGEDGRGELYVLTIGGSVHRIVPKAAAVDCEPLVGHPQKLSLTQGGVAQFELDAPNGFGYTVYLLLGTLSGTTPGLWIDGVNVPLNFDFYLLQTLASTTSGTFVNTVGLLDDEARAEASILLPGGALPPIAAGLTLQHAFVALSPFNGQLLYASNPEPLTLTP